MSGLVDAEDVSVSKTKTPVLVDNHVKVGQSSA